MKSSNALIVVAVLILVGGVAWFQTARQPAKNPATTTAPAVTPTTLVVQKGELCPDPPPTAKAGEPYKIRVIPTQIFFDLDGKEVWRHEGFLPKNDFIAKFAELGVK